MDRNTKFRRLRSYPKDLIRIVPSEGDFPTRIAYRPRLPRFMDAKITIMEVNLNGKTISTDAKNLAAFIEQQQIPTPGLAVAVGEEIVTRDKWAETELQDGVVITLIRATQGG